MSDLSRDEFLAHIEPMRRDLSDMIILQRTMNGRVVLLEERVPERLRERLTTVEERNPSKVAALVSSAFAAFGGVVAWFWARG